MRLHLPSVLLGAPLGALLLASTAALTPSASSAPAPPAQAIPPDLTPGEQIYGLVLSRDTAGFHPALTAETPIEVVSVRGDWLEVRSEVIPDGPVWMNFDQVIEYRVGED